MEEHIALIVENSYKMTNKQKKLDLLHHAAAQTINCFFDLMDEIEILAEEIDSPVKKVSCSSGKNKTVKSSSRGRQSILESMELGETRKFHGHSRYTVYSAMARRNRTYPNETFCCYQQNGATCVTRTK